MNGDSSKTRQPPQIIKSGRPSNNISLIEVFEVGIQLEYLRNQVNPVSEPLPKKSQVLQLLADIESSLSSQGARGTISKLIAKQEERIEGPDDAGDRINNQQAEELKKQVTSWIHLFTRKLSEETRIPASGSGILDVDVLTDNPQELFDPSVWEWLDERPRQDIREACRSVCVGCSTASVMLSLRAVEHCLRKWYEQDNDTLNAAWGQVLDQLMEEYTEDDKRNDTVLTQLSDLPPVLTTLYYLKEKRNEVNHPEESPSSREAERTLLIVSSTITEIFEVMRDEAVEEADSVQHEPDTITFYTAEKRSTVTEEQEEKIENLIISMDSGDGVQISKLRRAGLQDDFDEGEIRDAVHNLLMAGKVYEPADGLIKPI